MFLGLLDSVSDAVIITGEDGRIVIVNDRTEELFGYTPDELLGQSLDRLLPAKLGRRKDGSEFPVEIRANRIHIDDGVLMATAVQDIGDRVHRQTAVRLATQELEAIGQSVAHDLRVPVREIEAYGQVILDEHGEELDAAGVDCVHEIRARAGEMRSMLDALASLTQVTRQELVPEPIDLTAMAKTIVAELAGAVSTLA